MEWMILPTSCSERSLFVNVKQRLFQPVLSRELSSSLSRYLELFWIRLEVHPWDWRSFAYDVWFEDV